MDNRPIIEWLLQGDVSLQYQAHRDLLDNDRPDLQARIAHEGWGAAFLMKQNSNGHWGNGFYQPKWISTHYTLLDIRNLNMPRYCIEAKTAIKLILQNEKGIDGGISPARTISNSDVCINSLAL